MIRSHQNDVSHVVIIGGGISGLSAAWYLQRSEIPVRCTILEESSRWGGKVITDQLDLDADKPILVDGGPESFVTRKPELWNLGLELGLQEQMIAAGNEMRGIYILDHGIPKAMPTNPVAFIRSNLLSARGKLRLMAEPFISARRDNADESLADFVSRRLGHEALDKFLGPILGGIYNTDPEKQSIMVTSPVMREMERDHGSLVKALFARMSGKRHTPLSTVKPPRFVTFAGGTQKLIDALTDQLDADMRLNAGVSHIEHQGAGYRVFLQDGTCIDADGVILATPANISAKFLGKAQPEAAKLLREIMHSSLGTLTFVFNSADLPAEMPIRSLMIPRRENRLIDAITRTNERVSGRSSETYTLFRVFFGGSRPDTTTMPDNELIALVREELTTLIGIHAEPVATRAYTWPDDYPQAQVGHLELVTAIEKTLPNTLAVAGSSYRGLAVPDCIRNAKEAVNRITVAIQTHQHTYS